MSDPKEDLILSDVHLNHNERSNKRLGNNKIYLTKFRIRIPIFLSTHITNRERDCKDREVLHDDEGDLVVPRKDEARLHKNIRIANLARFANNPL